MIKKNTNKINLIISNTSIKLFFLWFFLSYIGVVFFFALFYYGIFHWSQIETLNPTQDFFGCLYFSFTFQLTIGGDNISAIGIARLLAVIQASIGMIFAGSGVSYLVIKLLSPNENTIVFSQYAFYVPKEKTFVIMLVNTTKTHLINIHFISILKYFRRHGGSRISFLPYLKNSVLTLKIGDLGIINNNPRDFDPQEDGLKVSIKCSLPFAQYVKAIKYSFDKILIIPSTDFRDIPILQEPDIKTEEFWNMFHNPIQNKKSLKDLLFDQRVSNSNDKINMPDI